MKFIEIIGELGFLLFRLIGFGGIIGKKGEQEGGFDVDWKNGQWLMVNCQWSIVDC